ncbi:MAG: 3-isopropylmalate dehydrogenase [Rickettsiales bacterium]
MSKNILFLPGDGIGPEVCAEVKKIINWFNHNYNSNFITEEALIGGVSTDQYGQPLTEETINLAKNADAILLGAVGGPKWEGLDIAMRPEKGLLKIRKSLDLFANLRPAITFKELVHSSTVKEEIISNLNIMIVRELTSGIYFGEPRGVKEVNGKKQGLNSLIYHEDEVLRVAEIAFDIATQRNHKLCSVDKANVLESTEMWRNIVTDLHKAKYSDIELSHMYVDNAAMQLVREPKQFDVIVTTNMFGDILSDIAAMLTGSLGMLPSASLGAKLENNKQHALYEPVHGSAPDLAGKNIANPLATILSFEMMLRYSFALHDLADKLNQAVKNVLAKGYRTMDIQEKNLQLVSTSEMGDLVIKELGSLQ